MVTRVCKYLAIFMVVAMSSLNAFAVEMNRVDIKKINISVELPSTFMEMPSEWVEIKYPSKNRPQVVYSNESGTVSFGMSKKDKSELVSLEQIKDAMLKAMSNFSPKASPINVDGYDAWLITFTSKAIDSDILNMQLITMTKNNFVIATFNMTAPNIEKYQPIGIRSLSSIKFQ